MGRVALFGLPPTMEKVPFDWDTFFRKRLDMHTVFGAQDEPGLPAFQLAVDYIASGQIDLADSKEDGTLKVSPDALEGVQLGGITHSASVLGLRDSRRRYPMTRRLTVEQPFDLELTLDMGQAFRWKRHGKEGWWSGVLGNHLVHIRQTGEDVEYRVGGPEGELDDIDLEERLRRYLMEDHPIQDIYDSISRDEQVGELVRQYPGMRVLQQDPWECLVSYILTASTNIDHTKAVVEAISSRRGCKLKLAGDVRHTFPSPETLADTSTELTSMTYPSLRFPQRQSEAIVEAAGQILAGTLDWSILTGKAYPVALRTLKAMRSVGYKVANCVALMSLSKLEAFPVDTWVRQAVELWYEDFPVPGRWEYPLTGDHDAMAWWACNKFGPYAGYAGQYLFHGIRQVAEAR